MKAARVIAEDKADAPRRTAFLRKNSKRHRHLNAQEPDDNRLEEVAVLFQIREAFRSGDIWLVHSRRYADLKQALVPVETAKVMPRLTMPFEREVWLANRKGTVVRRA